MSPLPQVTIVVPSRNAAATVPRCFDAIAAQDYPHELLEVVVGDGCSADGTVELMERHLAGTAIDLRVVENAEGTTPSNLNVALAAARGSIVCRVDTRSVLPPHYVRVCVETLQSRPEVAVVGGAVLTLPQSDQPTDIGVVRALNNRFAMGGAPYRAGGVSGVTDTAYLGAFRTDELRAAGGWDPVMLLNQDYELNRRMARIGLVWFDQRLEVGYLSRRRVPDVLRQYTKFGRWKVKYWRRFGDRPQRRQLLRMVLPPLAVAGCSAWCAKGPLLGRSIRLLVLGVAGGFAVEHVGSRGPESTSFHTRAVSVVTMAAVAGGWLAGIGLELVSGERLPPVHDHAGRGFLGSRPSC